MPLCSLSAHRTIPRLAVSLPCRCLRPCLRSRCPRLAPCGHDTSGAEGRPVFEDATPLRGAVDGQARNPRRLVGRETCLTPVGQRVTILLFPSE
jgi:hypothetical protein